MYYLYARVSSKGQNEERQLIALREFADRECDEGEFAIYIDKESGKDFDRQNYKKIIKKLKSGDVLVVMSIDRLGRNYDMILEQWRIITKDKNCDVVVLDMPLLDTRQRKDLMGTFIADLVLQLLSYCSSQELSNIKQRQAAGIAAAKARGVKFGRKPMTRPSNYEQIRRQYENGNISATIASYRLEVSRSTFAKWIKQDLED